MAWSSPRYARQNGGDGMMAQRKRNAALYVRVSTDNAIDNATDDGSML